MDGGHAEELREDGAQVAVGEAAGKKPEDAQGGEQGVHARITKPQAATRAPVPVMTGAQIWRITAWPSAGSWLSFSTASSRRVAEAGCPQRGQVIELFADAEVRASLIVVSVLSALPSLWYCFIFECL